MICSRQSYLFLSFVYLLSVRSSPYPLVRKVWFSDLSHLTLCWVYWNIFPRYNWRTGLRETYLCWLSAVLYLDFLARSQTCKMRLLASSCLSVRPSVRPPVSPHATTRFPLDGFLWNLIFEGFSKIHWESSSFSKIGPEWRVLYMKTNILFYHISLSYS